MVGAIDNSNHPRRLVEVVAPAMHHSIDNQPVTGSQTDFAIFQDKDGFA
jgi:hypothetical protein